MKKYAFAAACLFSAVTISAQQRENDSLRTVNVGEISVIATRATEKTPFTQTTVSKQEIEKNNFGQDIPILLQTTPSVVATSDAGNGIGYTSIRIRGTDASRINVTTNGIPMNDAESCTVFWVNTPDFVSSLSDIQIQRGVGTSTNGAGAFGGTIDMQTGTSASKPYLGADFSYGSYNTHKESIKLGTGVLGKHWSFDARLSNIMSDGYRDRASADLKSYFVQALYSSPKSTVKFLTFSGNERTYHAWDGLDSETLKENRKYNPNGEIKDDNGNVIGFYDNQIDKYKQTHYQLHFKHILSASWRMNLAAHYTDGYGYYEEYKNDRTLVEYGIDGDKSDLVRRKCVSSDFVGGIFSFEYQKDKFSTIIGGGYNQYVNDHYGRVLWLEKSNGTTPINHEYYRNQSNKYDGNIYARANLTLKDRIDLYADVQYRYVKYTINGINDKYDWLSASPQKLNVDNQFNFVNPKVGINWRINPSNRVYLSVAMAHKEPTRNNYTDNLFNANPKPERLIDYELGYSLRKGIVDFGANLYYMDYKNQLVLNGQVNEIGEMVTENVDKSYRTGIELTASITPIDWFSWSANATFSRNKIKNYSHYLSDVDEDWNEIYTEEGTMSQTIQNLGNTSIAFSPNIVANSIFSFNYKGFDAQLQTQYVSKQYLNNAEQEDCTLRAYCTTNLNLAYTIKTKTVKSITFGVAVYNMFNSEYETNGYASGYAVYNGNELQYTSNYAAYYPAAKINALGRISFTF